MANNKDNSKNEGGDERVDLLDTIKHRKQREFLLAYREAGTIKGASEATGMARSNHYEWMQTYASYRRAFNRELLVTSYSVHDSLVQRLRDGWEEPVYQGGVLVGYKQRYDNPTSMRYLENVNPDVFGPKRQVEVTHPEGTNITPSDEVVAMDDMVPREGDEEGAGNEQGG